MKITCLIISLFTALLFSGCVSAHKRGRTTHEIWEYQIVPQQNGQAASLLTCHEIWMDEYKGGGVALLSDPTASQLNSYHTNQSALGGASVLSIGSFHSEVSTNGIIATGEAGSKIIQGVGAAIGQAANKAVTGVPVK
jgi:hypothetical protein